MSRGRASVIALIVLSLFTTPAIVAAEDATTNSSSSSSAQPTATATSTATSTSTASTDTSNTKPADTAPAKPAPEPERVFSINQVEVFWTGKAKPDAIYGYGTKTQDLATAQFEHFSFHKWGEIYLDAEAYMGHQTGYPFAVGESWQSLLVFNPYFSIAKMAGKKGLQIKPLHIQDVQVVARFEKESYPDSNSTSGPGHFWTRNFGATLVFNFPGRWGFAWFESGLLERWDNIDNKETWLWRSVVLSQPWKVGGEKFHYNLLSLVNGSRGNGVEIFERNDFLWEVHGTHNWQLGARLEIENYNHDPISMVFDGLDRRYSRVMPEAMVKYIF